MATDCSLKKSKNEQPSEQARKQKKVTASALTSVWIFWDSIRDFSYVWYFSTFSTYAHLQIAQCRPALNHASTLLTSCKGDSATPHRWEQCLCACKLLLHFHSLKHPTYLIWCSCCYWPQKKETKHFKCKFGTKYTVGNYVWHLGFKVTDGCFYLFCQSHLSQWG